MMMDISIYSVVGLIMLLIISVLGIALKIILARKRHQLEGADGVDKTKMPDDTVDDGYKLI